MSELELKMERWRYPRFFTENISDTAAVLDREDSKHVSQVLRMRPGEFAVICDGKGTDYLGRLESAEGECVFEILEKSPNQAEPSVHLRLFQAMPKGDKMDFIVQKAVECGACEVVPFISKRCVSRPDAKQLAKKTERWQRIAYEAAKQCGRGKCQPWHQSGAQSSGRLSHVGFWAAHVRNASLSLIRRFFCSSCKSASRSDRA